MEFDHLTRDQLLDIVVEAVPRANKCEQREAENEKLRELLNKLCDETELSPYWISKIHKTLEK
jgi:hypothetical protein